MTTQIAPRDWEILSAYLDNQLNDKERNRLEMQLQGNLELRQALEEMRRTRTILRHAPRLRAPRNFTLTPNMAGRRQDSRALPGAYPVLQLASVLATVFFFVVSAGSLAISAIQPEPIVVMRADQNRSSPSIGMGGGGGGVVEQPVAPAPTEAAAKMMLEGETTATEGLMLQVTPLPPAEAATTPEDLQAFAAPKEVSPVEPPVAAQAPESNLSESASNEQPRSGFRAWNLLILLQVLLASLAIGCGLAAFYIRRSSTY